MTHRTRLSEPDTALKRLPAHRIDDLASGEVDDIIHGIWDDVICGCVLEVLPDVVKMWDIPYSIRADYFDTGKSIAHHEH